ncbi:YdcF family protein [Brevibacterium spongiae]|uniref:YdcF family protein n=1 Tax=Brevibacterium spongiae TaxID=2909672 RepID=A0ABY5SJF8_9MICO|nr:YdcF family protein [Brevibacterium spongiae]UVI34650.1 YdcF family protein [Brevibacterium spongiae]
MPVGIACAGLAGAALASVIAFAEYTHWTSSHRRLGGTGLSSGGPGHVRAGDVRPGDGRGMSGGGRIIVVLGYRNRGERANGINRFRVRAGLRTIDSQTRSAVLILCGGAVGGQTPEARILERFAREELGFTGRILLETQSMTTWQNIVNAIPLIDEELRPDSTISIVSNAHHAEKARDHLWQLRPDLARRLVRGGDYRFGEQPVVKPIAAVRGLLALRELDRSKRARVG